MITFKSVVDLSRLPRSDPSRSVILDLLRQFPRDPESQGYIVLLQPGDTHVTLPELKSCISAIGWDGVYRRGNFWIAVYLTNNEFTLEFIIPDAEWLEANIRANLEDQAQKGPPYMKEVPF